MIAAQHKLQTHIARHIVRTAGWPEPQAPAAVLQQWIIRSDKKLIYIRPTVELKACLQRREPHLDALRRNLRDKLHAFE